MEYFFNEHESHEFNKREGLREAEKIRQIRQIRGRKKKRRTLWDENIGYAKLKIRQIHGRKKE